MGLNFQTCTIVNSMLDADGKSIFNSVDGENDVLRIKRDFVFKKDCVKALRGKKASAPVACKAVVDCSKLKAGDYRMDVFVKYEGAEPAYGANPIHTYKGIPFWVEFSVKEGQSDIADVIANRIKKDHLFLIDKDVISVEADGNTLTLVGATEYARFGSINISKIDMLGEEEVVAEIGNNVELEKKGANGFGTYSHLIKDLRLPTAANYQWSHLYQDETPVIGALYNQYIIEYCAPAINEGTMFVGHRGMNWTTHVFWVNTDNESDWEDALSKLGEVDWADAEATESAEDLEN